jgi:hypothetical protein
VCTLRHAFPALLADQARHYVVSVSYLRRPADPRLSLPERSNLCIESCSLAWHGAIRRPERGAVVHAPTLYICTSSHIWTCGLNTGLGRPVGANQRKLTPGSFAQHG